MKRNIYMYEVGKLCKEMRKQLNLSVMDIAKVANKTYQQIWQFENGYDDSASSLIAYFKFGYVELPSRGEYFDNLK